MKFHSKLVSALAFTFLITNYSAASTTDNKQNPANKATTEAPNVIVIVADQMRRASMGFWQQEKFKGALNGKSDYVITPNLDKLANEGAVFTQAIANYPLCSPFRGMLLSGLYPHKNGVYNNARKDRPDLSLRTDITTLTEVFANANYNTALVGKAHWQNHVPHYDKENRYVGTDQPPGGHYLKSTKYDTYVPPGEGRQGIEYWYQMLGHNHQNPLVFTNDTQLSGKPDGHPYHPKTYSAVDQANVIIDYLNNNRQQRDTNKPFSLLWTMDPPHTPYTELTDTDIDVYNKYYKDIAIETLLNRDNVDIKTAEKVARIHFSMVTVVDREIGRILTALEKQGLADNTLIVFTADHGEMMGSHGLKTKNFVYEESLSIPLIFHYPKKIPAHITDLLINVPDFMPTILGLANLEKHIPNALDGENFTSYVLNQTTHSIPKPRSSLYFGKSDELGVKTDRYTYAINKEGKIIALFDNINDPYQLSLLRLEDLPTGDAKMLKDELGMWLTRIEHRYAQDKTLANMINYPH